MQVGVEKQIYPYLFLLGNCLVWYATDIIHEQILYLLILVPFLLYFPAGRLIGFILLGCCFSEFTAISQQQWKLSEQHVPDNHLIVGSVEALPVNKGKITRLRFRVVSINHIDINSDQPVYFRLSCYRGCPDFKADQTWQLLVRLKPPNGYLNATGFDYEKWLYGQQFKATGYILNSTQNYLLSTEIGIDTYRQSIREYFIQHLDDDVILGSAIALTLGDKSQLGAKQQQLLAENGLSHLMAISGLHIGLSAIPGFIFAGLLWRRVRYLQRFSRIQFQWVVCILPALGYTALSGFGLPAWRALVMLLVFAGAHLTRQSISTHSRFSLALWFILLSQPLAPLQISFWLSFCATGILIFLSQLYQPKNQFNSLVQLQSQLFVLLLPIQLFLFGTVSLLSPLLNFIAIPFVSFLLLPLLLLLVFFILLSIPGVEFLLWMTEQLLTIFWKALTFIGPFSEHLQFSSTEITIWHLLCYPLLLLLLLTFQLRVKITIISTLMLLMVEQKQPELFRMMTLDVGQGLAVSVDYHNKHLIYDTAYGSEDFSVAEMTILPWLKSIAVSSVDLLVIGHNDADHAGGARLLMNALKIKELVTGPDVKVPEGTFYLPQTINSCKLGQQWKWGELIISVLSPETGNRHLKEGNDTSCVLLFEINGKRILLTGDIEAGAEDQLLKNYPDLAADILLIPHHGSKTSSTEAFVEQVNPKVGIISSGYLNRFNLPAENIIKRYQNNGVEVFNTAYSGAIELTINAQGIIVIKQWRLDNTTLWRRH